MRETRLVLPALAIALTSGVAALRLCATKSVPVPVPAYTPPSHVPAVSDDQIRSRGALTATEHAGQFEITDGAKHVKITVPSAPQLQGQMVSQDGIQMFNAQAVVAGPVDLQFQVISVKDDALPPALTTMMGSLPDQLAAAASGTLVKNERAVLVGSPGQRFEITTTDGRRLFGWFIAVAADARLYQLNCVGDDQPATRTACTKVFDSIALSI